MRRDINMATGRNNSLKKVGCAVQYDTKIYVKDREKTYIHTNINVSMHQKVETHF